MAMATQIGSSNGWSQQHLNMMKVKIKLPMCLLRMPTLEDQALTAEMMAAQAISRGLSVKEVVKEMAQEVGHDQDQDLQTHSAEASERTIRRAKMPRKLAKHSQK
jgi:hypothetical protein